MTNSFSKFISLIKTPNLKLVVTVASILLSVSCEQIDITLKSKPKKSSVSGIISPFVGMIAENSRSNNFLLAEAIATSCSEPVIASLYQLKLDGSIDPDHPLASQTVGNDSRYSFNLSDLKISSSNSKIEYIVRAYGCDGRIFKRPITNFDSNQDLNFESTVVGSVLNATELVSTKMNNAEKKDVDLLIKSLTGNTASLAINSLINEAAPSLKFTEIFGVAASVLLLGKPEVNLISPATINELAPNTFRADAFHFDPTYSMAYVWKLDGVVKSTSANWTYVPSANDSGTHRLDLYIGKDNGSGAINLTLPYFFQSKNIIVNNNISPTPPNITINSATPSPRFVNTINIDINTGVSSANCGSFSHLAFTDSPTPPGILQFNIDCTNSGTQTETVTFSIIDGTRTLYLWAIDNEGYISTPTTISFVFDSTPPLAPAFAVTSLNPTSSPIISTTISSCTNIQDVLITELNLMPSTLDPGWTTCNTNTNGYSFSISGDGVHQLHLWAREQSGAVSLASTNHSVTLDTSNPIIATQLATASILKGGSSSNITWSVTDLSNVTIALSYSLDGGTTYNNITNSTANNGTYSWSVPSTDSQNVKLKLVATDQFGYFATSISNTVAIDSTAPIVAISPISTILKGGSVITINYTAADTNQITTLDLAFSSDGVTYGAATLLTANSTSSTWNVNLVNSTTAKIRIKATDAAGNIGIQESNIFTIDSTPPNAPTLARTSSSNTNISLVTLTLGSCLDTYDILINEVNTPPSPMASGWVACSTVASAITYSVAGQGLHTLYAWARDQAGNIATTANSVTLTFDNLGPVISTLGIASNVLGGGSSTISWSASDANTFLVNLEYYNGASWTSLATSVANTGSYSWTTIPSLNLINSQIRMIAIDSLGNSTQSLSNNFSIDSSASIANSLSINSGATSTNNKNILLNFISDDTYGKVSEFCLKFNNATSPLISDSCWVTLASVSVTPASHLVISNYPVTLSSIAGDYTVTIWYKDSFGHISSLTNSGNGTNGIDKATISYVPDPAPVLTNTIAANSDSPSSPLLNSDVSAPLGYDLYVKWNITDNLPIPNGNISLYYTIDETNYTLVSSGLNNAINGACTIGGSYTGCFKWTAASPLNSYYKIKIIVTDSAGATIFEYSNPLNTGKVNYLSGNTSLGIGGTALNSIIFGAGEQTYNDFLDAQSMVVTKSGYIFYRYYNRGLVYISPQDGIIRDVTAQTGTMSGDGGNVFNASFKNFGRMVLDYNDNIYLWDYDRVRKIDLSTNPWTITTLFGGGADSSDGASALSANIGLNYADQLTVTPNGRVYFNKNSDIWFYDPADFKIKKYVTLTGVGTGDMLSWRTTFDNVACPGSNASFAFNKSDSSFTKIVRKMAQTAAVICGSASQTTPGYNTSFNPITGVAEAPHPTETFWSSFKFTGMDGNIYLLEQGRGTLKKYIPGSNTFQTILGASTGNGRCADGTLATSCNAVVMSAFVSEFGKVYFVDLGVLRTIDSNGFIQTLAGQPRNFGIGYQPSNARFSKISFFDINGNDIYVKNELENQIVKFSMLGGNVSLIAGNTIRGNPTMGANAMTSSLPNCAWSVPCGFIVDSAHNRLYHYAAGNNVSYIDLASNLWVNQFSGVQDGGTRVSFLGNGSDGMLMYLPSHYGSSGNKVTMRVFNPSTSALTHVYGLDAIQNGLSTTICNGAVGTSCSIDHTMDDSIQVATKFDSSTNNWLLTTRSSNQIFDLASLGGTTSLFSTLSNSLVAYDFYKSGVDDYIFYCSTSGNLYKKNLTTTIETQLVLPTTAMKCTSASLFYKASRNSLIFAYTQNGLYGIAEYLNP